MGGRRSSERLWSGIEIEAVTAYGLGSLIGIKSGRKAGLHLNISENSGLLDWTQRARDIQV